MASNDDSLDTQQLLAINRQFIANVSDIPEDSDFAAAMARRSQLSSHFNARPSTDFAQDSMTSPPEAHPHPDDKARQAARPENAFVRDVMHPPDTRFARQTTVKYPRTYSKRRITARGAIIERRALVFHNSQNDALPPQLRKANSTPAVAMAVEYDGFPAWRSFAEGMGDTQRINTQDFKAASDLGLALTANTYFEDGQEVVMHRELDLAASIEDGQEDADIDISSITNESPQAQFKIPKTPAMAGSKRDSMGNVVSSVTRSSSSRLPPTALKNMFGNAHPVGDISFTQAFNYTQNISSPVTALRSDPVFERPSPNFCLDQSSPSNVPHRMTSDPIDHYKSMEESQKEREQRLKEQQARVGEDEDDFLESWPNEYERRMRRREELKKVREEFLMFDVPKRPRSAHAAFSDEKLITPARSTAGTKATEPIHVSDETQLSDDDESDAGFSSTKGVQVPMTSSRGKSLSQRPILSSPSKASIENPIHVRGTDEESAMGEKASGTQKSLAIADSQDPTSGAKGITLSQESDTRIVQSQYSIQPVKAVDTSSVSAPPPTTSQAQGEQVPSSPPATNAMHAQEDEQGDEDVENAHHLRVKIVDEAQAVSPEGDEMDIDGPSVTRIPARMTSSADRSILTSVPESDPVDSPIAKQQSDLCGRQPTSLFSRTDTSEAPSKTANTMTTNSTEVFHTAKTHPSPNPDKIHTQNSTATDESPIRNGRIKRLTEIANDPTPHGFLESALDFNVLDHHDQEHLDAMAGKTTGGRTTTSSAESSPVHPNKRRRFNHPRPLSEPAKNVNIIERQDSASRDEADEMHDLPEEDLSENPGTHEPAPLKQLDAVNKPSIQKKMGTLRRPTKKPSTYTNKMKPTISGERCANKTQTEQTPTGDVNSTAKELRKDSVVTTPSNAAPADPDREIIVPNRVLAWFGRSELAYFPATCANKLHANDRLEVRFDDGTTGLPEKHQIRRLELRVGDHVKIYRNKLRAKTFVVIGFKNKIDPSKYEFPLTDIHGYDTVLLVIKGRDSTVAADIDEKDILEIPLTDVFLNGNLWPKFADRPYEPLKLYPPAAPVRFFTPSDATSTPTTPSSRSRRLSAKDAKTSTVQQSFKPDPAVRTALFTNMIFAVSLGSQHDDSKNDTIKCVLENGGTVLNLGFDELFYDIEASKSFTSTEAEGDEDGGSEALQLRPWAKETGFTALLASSHSRTAKYVQALALGLPCLHYRWVTDCMAADTVLEWGRYLLPAGESSFLKAVRSRVLMPYDPLSDEARLERVLRRRNLLLGGMKVLFVTGKGKAEERKKAYEFLTFALGAKSVVKVRNFIEAKTEAGKGLFDVVYTEGDEEYKRAIFERENGGGGKGGKRKTGNDGRTDGSASMSGKGIPRFVNDEFVVQSLILGDLME